MCWTEIGRFGKEIANQTALLLPLIVLFVYSIYNTIVVKMFEISRVLTCINIVFMMGKKRKLGSRIVSGIPRLIILALVFF
jgi:hypothetical protein